PIAEVEAALQPIAEVEAAPQPVAEVEPSIIEESEPVAEIAVEPPQPAPEARAPKPSWPVVVPPPAVVLPIARNPIRSIDFQPPPVADPTMTGLDRLLRVSAARGASTLYLSTD